ncbi:HalOD1 output domain-containing protein [Natrarchaeobius chitinivorans]|uniref:Halobacterial output domain-containing protein n=1 Tax=Natrarchaeobius chitinivorans TaxID=1679083 RepID=A0A3N6M4E4_NATCH|nr:HalOD1 output domain-containing protein [Natrarchaeobius chitinivorans]RQG90830.1 hypothetical protein EA473_19675 [Natrarchaeobius chitinivorans]
MPLTTETSPSVAIVTEIARHEGVSPEALQPPLWKVIDPEALDRLFERTEQVGTVRFHYLDYGIEFDSDSGVEVTPIEEPATTS